jgi:hypothetical protein
VSGSSSTDWLKSVEKTSLVIVQGILSTDSPKFCNVRWVRVAGRVMLLREWRLYKIKIKFVTCGGIENGE